MTGSIQQPAHLVKEVSGGTAVFPTPTSSAHEQPRALKRLDSVAAHAPGRILACSWRGEAFPVFRSLPLYGSDGEGKKQGGFNGPSECLVVVLMP